MEEIEKIKLFLSLGSGYGSGDGDGDGDGYGYGSGSGYGYGSGSGYGYGSGSGSGYGSGDGSGSGSGSGSGYGSGSGDGSGYGDGIKEINNHEVYMIDGTPTLIDSVHGNYAKGSILNSDLTLTPCFVAKCDNYFAHGETLREALEDARAKYENNLPTEERIRHFMETYPTLDTQASHKDLFRWHNTLTGSCEMGRREWCKSHGLDPEEGTMTVRRFIFLTEDSYGGDVIRQLKEEYDKK